MPFNDEGQPLSPFSFSEDHATEPSLAVLLQSAQSQRPAEVIQCVHDSATVKYRISKRLKQQEFAYKITEAQRTNDRTKLKNEKKRIDNHASAVASRIKQEFLVTSFESLVREKMHDSFRLAEAVKKYQSVSANKDAEIRKMSRRISQLTKEVADLSALSAQNQVRPSSDIPVRDEDAWVSSDEFGLDSRLTTGGSALEELSQQPIHRVQTQEGNLEAQKEDGSALTMYIEHANSQAREIGDGQYKFEFWEPLPEAVIAERQSSFTARLRPDEYDESFNPVA